jgi:tRNA (cytidine/uridine-2'-O-)-methyltransferase
MMAHDITKTGHRTIKSPALHVVLYQPEIPPNTGSIARLCGAAEVRLHLIHPLGFRVDDKHLKRAGLDYWYEVDIQHHMTFQAFLAKRDEGEERQMIAFSRHATQVYTEAGVRYGDYLLFGQETRGLPPEIQKAYPCYRVPIWGRVRSLNLASTVGIVVYHYLHEIGRF